MVIWLVVIFTPEPPNAAIGVVSAKHAALSLPLFSGCTITRKKAAAKKRTAHRRAS
jgi:hypothetical protein